MISREDAEEYTQSLGQIMGGTWRQIALADKMRVPQALGLSTQDWVRSRLGGYARLSIPDRREAIAELVLKDGVSQRKAAEILGVTNATVSRDLGVTNVTLPPEHPPESVTNVTPEESENRGDKAVAKRIKLIGSDIYARQAIESLEKMLPFEDREAGFEMVMEWINKNSKTKWRKK